MKNLIIVVLAVLCAALSYVQFGPDARMPSAFPHEIIQCNTEKVATTDVIRTAVVDGISLSTPLERVDDLIKAAGFTCNKTDTTTENAASRPLISWRCEHPQYPNTQMNILAKNGEITNINRSGGIDFTMVHSIRTYIEALKLRLDNYEDVYFNQTPVKTDLMIRSVNEDVSGQMHYTLFVQEQESADGTVETTAQYRVAISRQ